MAKRIEFIAPVEAVRGNLSGKQELVYPSSNNRAFEAVQGKVNYARNYRPSYVGAKRSSDGLKFFAVRTKNAVNLSPIARMNMAVNGASFAITSKILADESLSTSLRTQYGAAVNAGQFEGNFRQFVNYYATQMLTSYSRSIDINYIGLTNKIYNPWYGDRVSDYSPKKEVIIKFWTLLHEGGITFNVNNLTGISIEGESFDQLTDSPQNYLNVLGLSTQTIGSNTYVKMGDFYLLNSAGEYVNNDDDVIADGKYKTTITAPTA